MCVLTQVWDNAIYYTHELNPAYKYPDQLL